MKKKLFAPYYHIHCLYLEVNDATRFNLLHVLSCFSWFIKHRPLLPLEQDWLLLSFSNSNGYISGMNEILRLDIHMVGFGIYMWSWKFDKYNCLLLPCCFPVCNFPDNIYVQRMVWSLKLGKSILFSLSMAHSCYFLDYFLSKLDASVSWMNTKTALQQHVHIEGQRGGWARHWDNNVRESTSLWLWLKARFGLCIVASNFSFGTKLLYLCEYLKIYKRVNI